MWGAGTPALLDKNMVKAYAGVVPDQDRKIIITTEKKIRKGLESERGIIFGTFDIDKAIMQDRKVILHNLDDFRVEGQKLI